MYIMLNNDEHKRIIIEAVTVCVGYGDFLAITLPYTLAQVDYYTIVGNHTKDSQIAQKLGIPITKELCRKHSVPYIDTDTFYHNEATFNKARGINRALDMLYKQNWLLHIDADIVLPQQTKEVLNRIYLDPNCIYGIDRVECSSYKAWEDYQRKNINRQLNYHCIIESPPFPLMGRYMYRDDGYLPIGYFQLWHGNKDVRYIDRYNNAVRSDVQHALQWDGKYRRLIPEIISIHLDSINSPIGANWLGRTTPAFKPNYNPSNNSVKSFYSPLFTGKL